MEHRYLVNLESYKREVHATDYTNASRTMIFDIHSLSGMRSFLKYWTYWGNASKRTSFGILWVYK